MTADGGQASGAVKFSMAELARRTGCSPRTIRFYIGKGLLPGPIKAGRDARYGEEHARRIDRIRERQAEGLTLTEIARELGGARSLAAVPRPAAWWSYRLDDDVIVQVRADASPWRLRRIQRALTEMAAGLAQTKAERE